MLKPPKNVPEIMGNKLFVQRTLHSQTGVNFLWLPTANIFLSTFWPNKFYPTSIENLGPKTCFARPKNCFLGPKNCFVKPKTCFLGPKTCFVRPKTCFLGPKTCFVKPQPVFGTENLFSWTETCFLGPKTSFLGPKT